MGKSKYIFIIIITLIFTSCTSLDNYLTKTNGTTIIVPDQYSTIQEAINNSHDGDTIYIRKGIYEGNIKLSKAVSLIGESPENTIILPNEDNCEKGIDITFSRFSNSPFFSLRNTDYVQISSLQIRNFNTGIFIAYNDIKSIDNCIIISNNSFAPTLWLQGTNTHIYNCTLIGKLLAYECASLIENNIMSYNFEQKSFLNDNSVLSIDNSEKINFQNNVIWGTSNFLVNSTNIFADPKFKNIEKYQYGSIYSADLKGAIIEGEYVEKDLDLLGPEITILNDISTDDLNIIDKKDIVLNIKIIDNSPITRVKIETESIECLDEFTFERAKYKKEIQRTLIMQPGYNIINIYSEDLYGNSSSKRITFQLGEDTIPRSFWNVSISEQEQIKKYDNKIGLSIGIQNYPQGLNTIKYAENDAKAINELLKDNGYNTLPILLNPTLDQLKYSLVKLSNEAKEFDKVVIYISGHGSNKSNIFSNSRGLILPIDVDITDLSVTSFPMEDFRDYIANLESKTVIIILDMCFSSGGKGFGETSKAANDSTITEFLIDTGQGKILLASSGDNELSFEDDKLKHGVFTFYLLEAVDKGKISIDAIYNYVYAHIKESSRWNQTPKKIMLSDDIEGYHTLF